MKIKLLVSLSGAITHHAGDEIDVSDNEAYNLINGGAAKPLSKDGFKALETRIEKAKADDELKQAQIIAIQKKDELSNEADTLLENILAIVSTLSSNDAEYKDGFLAKFHEKWLEVFPEAEGDEIGANGDVVTAEHLLASKIETKGKEVKNETQTNNAAN